MQRIPTLHLAGFPIVSSQLVPNPIQPGGLFRAYRLEEFITDINLAGQ